YKTMAKILLGDRAVFTHYVAFSDLPVYYRTADVFCAPATGGESFGIVLLEAMASGTPVVATDIPGYASVLTHGQEGLLAPPKNPRALADALLKLLTDRQLRLAMAERGVATANKYSWENVSRQVVDYYTSILINLRG
ncbi:MAG: glycosyltransferase, partial [Chloroflexi bacterium]|nr:glycosyltransferase [Chloroflexota bacterium]